MITFDQYKEQREILSLRYSHASKVIMQLSIDHKGDMGLLNPDLLASAPYKAAKTILDKTFTDLRSFNGSMPEEYKKRNRRYL